MEKFYKGKANEGFYGSPASLSRASGVSPKKTAKFLSGEDAYTLNRQVIRKFQRRKVRSWYPNHIWCSDLAQFPTTKFKKITFQGAKYILIVVDYFTKKMYTRVLSKKNTNMVATAFEDILHESQEYPQLLHVDRGTEYTSQHFKTMLEKYGIRSYHTNTVIKSAICERAVRSIMHRYYTLATDLKNKMNIREAMRQVTDSINDSISRVTGFKPNEITEKDIPVILQRMYKDEAPVGKIYFTVGDRVRVAKDKGVYRKGYKSTFSKDIYVVDEVQKTKRATYLLRHEDGERRLTRPYYRFEFLGVT
jgi:transposase InsO family protein